MWYINVVRHTILRSRSSSVTISPLEFVERWGRAELREQQAAQSHFNELCDLVGHKTPTEMDPEGQFFTFEEHVTKAAGGRGRADVWYKDHFAWEYKGKHKSLDDAYAQLLSYKTDLNNPPLLVVCDFLEYRIYPQWPNMSGLPFKFTNQDLLNDEARRYITWLLTDPDKFREARQSELERREKLTLQLANQFAHLADRMRRHTGPDGKPLWEPMQIARFLTRLTFVMFAEDVGLLPRVGSVPAFRWLLERVKAEAASQFVPALTELFEAMDGQREYFYLARVPYFNGGLFADSAPGANDGKEVLDITQLPANVGLELLSQVAEADWRFVNPTIFGTLFEGALDESKRAQLGAHYTSEADIRLVIEPVLMQPLYRLWDAIRTEAEPLLQTYRDSSATPRDRQAAQDKLTALHDRMMDKLQNTRVLDPACGSGNFLYVSLRAMKDLEAVVRKTFEPLNLPFRDVVTPRQLYGIEKDEFAARLAQVVVWIGYLQWRYEDEGGVLHPYLKQSSRPHPRQLPTPIIKDKDSPDEPDRIVCDDAILRYDAEGKPYEPEWPLADVIVSNPPFLGGKRLRTELRDQYVDQLFTLYEGRVPHEADLVCYWYEKARAQIEHGKTMRAGMLATNSIRGGANRVVLDRIKQTGDIFMAWSDRPWVLAGAAVRISIVGFDSGTQKEYLLDGAPVLSINSDLQNTIDATKARALVQNKNIAFMADTKNGPFDIPGELAREMLNATNRSGRSNSDVVRPWMNGLDVTRRPRDMWIIDFGTDMTLEEAQLYEMPFEYVQRVVYPERKESRTPRAREVWWRHEAPRPEMRKALAGLKRFIVSPYVAKHRVFIWLQPEILADHQLIAVAREDDYFFGVLHSHLHEIWSLRLGTSLEDRPRYTPTTTFETFPFPWPPGKEPTDQPAYLAISAAAKQLHEEREAWLNPPDLQGASLKERTLTNLYNALQDYRAARRQGQVWLAEERSPARKFAPRLAELHDALDQAVLAAYGWLDLFERLRTSEGDEELLRRLLALNLQRAGGGSSASPSPQGGEGVRG
jgi:type II restriction/modification system DNA methylase subunit YeeA